MPSRGVVAIAIMAVATATTPTPPVLADEQQTYAALVADYRDGDPDRAVRTFAAWSIERVRAEVPADAMAATWPEVGFEMLLLLETSVFRATAGRTFRVDVHGELAAGALRSQFDQPGAPTMNDVWLQELVRLLPVYQHMEEGWPWGWPSEVAASAEAHLLIGRREARGMGPLVPENQGILVGTGPRVSTSHGVFSARFARAAERAFRAAIAGRPDMTEASLRLGWLLIQLDRAEEAVAPLQRATASVNDPVARQVQYLAYLLLGRIEEGRRNNGAALDAYARAVAVHRGPIALLALGRARIALHDHAGWDDMRTAARAPLPDPWYTLDAVWTTWDHAVRLRALRQSLLEPA